MGDVHSETSGGISRREALRKGAVAGGAIVWAVPLVQSVGMPGAFGQSAGTPRCDCRVRVTDLSGNCLADNCQLTPAACDCLQNTCNCDPSGCTCNFVDIVPGSCSPC